MGLWHKNLRFPYGRLTHTRLKIPRLNVEIRSPQHERLTREVNAILDTGSDRTCIPARVFTELGERNFEYGIAKVQGAGGGPFQRTTFIVHVRFGECDFYDLEVISLEEDFALIGRDILNQHKVTLDGPKLRFDITKSC